ncbi:hypothetical protein ASE74_04895 [Pedobacter sp. Leaf216]|uniref:hypothetical protein n=1 Tax=Pedobacter sp. Leaf216 TaxID=1735684 RepID=UPI0006F4031F|nr:hypothetical protein [Pedobacter sp. Leaf216]KQM69347.1 hypothetical protein ASE74_04895 [Pedobacter sp. Leaf216]
MKLIFYIIAAGSLFVAGCKGATDPDRLINSKASLPSTFRLSELHEKVITSLINKKVGTMSILYGDEHFKNATQESNLNVPGNSFTLVTWKQQDDAHWFGARIPGELISAETINIGNHTNFVTYRKFMGKNLLLSADTTGQNERIHFILTQRPSIIP